MRFTIKKGFIQQKTNQTLVIFDTEKSLLYTFNTTAKYIFEHLKKGENAEQILEQMQKKFQVSETEGRKDMKKFISELTKKGIIDEQ